MALLISSRSWMETACLIQTSFLSLQLLLILCDYIASVRNFSHKLHLSMQINQMLISDVSSPNNLVS